MTTCKDWYGDIREMCSRQTVIAFRFKETRYSFRQCHVKSHFIPETEVIPIDPNYMQRMSNNDAKAAFYKLFPNLKVITIQTSLGKDFISPYQQSLECLHVVSLNWTRSGPESFERITCMAMDDATGNRISKKTFPSLKSLTTGPGIEFFIRSLPSHLTRLHCSVISIIKIGNADFASNLTHLRMDIVRCGLSSTFSFPNLKSLVIKDASGFKIIEMTSVMATHMKVPKLKSLGLFLNRWVYSWSVLIELTIAFLTFVVVVEKTTGNRKK